MVRQSFRYGSVKEASREGGLACSLGRKKLNLDSQGRHNFGILQYIMYQEKKS